MTLLLVPPARPWPRPRLSRSTRFWGILGAGIRSRGSGASPRALEVRSYADSRAAGVVHVAALVAVDRRARRAASSWLAPGAGRWPGSLSPRPAPGPCWAVGRCAARPTTIAGQLADGDLAGARDRVRNLVGRETAGLSAGEVARATVESLAENTSDAVVAPLLWGAVAGLPGLLGYRAVNTLDAMIGHRCAALPPVRLGGGAARRRGQLGPGAGDRPGRGRLRSAGRRVSVDGMDGRPAGRRPAPEPQCRGGRGGVRRGARGPARRPQHLRRTRRGPGHPRRRPGPVRPSTSPGRPAGRRRSRGDRTRPGRDAALGDADDRR